MNIITNIIVYITIFIEIAVIITTYYYLKKEYNYAVYCYNKNYSNRPKKIFIEKEDNIVENIIVSNITQKIDTNELNDKISIPVLSFRLDGQQIAEIPMNNEKIFIGRGKSDDVVINEPTISRSHCVITKEDDKYFINIDINKNPIKLNKKQIIKEKEKPFKKEISNGDIVSMGDGRISFQFIWRQNLGIA